MHWGMSEASAKSIRTAHTVCPLSAVQSEYSLIWREPETKIFPTLQELGIGFVPYYPMGRAILTGAVKADSRFGKDDRRATLPMFTPEALPQNMAIYELVKKWAKRKMLLRRSLPWFEYYRKKIGLRQFLGQQIFSI